MPTLFCPNQGCTVHWSILLLFPYRSLLPKENERSSSLQRVPVLITECQFICPTHREAKQTEMVMFWVEKDLLQGQAKRIGDSCSKTLNSLMFREEVFIGKIWDERGRVCDFLLIDWWWGNRAVLCAQLHLGWGPYFLQKNSKICLGVFLQEEPGPCPTATRVLEGVVCPQGPIWFQ